MMKARTEMGSWVARWVAEQDNFYRISEAYDENFGVAAVLSRKSDCSTVIVGVFRESYEQFAKHEWRIDGWQAKQNFNKIEIGGCEDEYLFIHLAKEKPGWYHETICFPLEKAYTGLEARIRELVLSLMSEKAPKGCYINRGISQFIKMTGDERAYAVKYSVLDHHGRPSDFGFEVWEEDDGSLTHREIENKSDSSCFMIMSAEVIDKKTHLHLSSVVIL